jgi:hypothetical protein
MTQVSGEVYGTTEKLTLAGRILEALAPLNFFAGPYVAPKRKPHILVKTDDGKTESFLKEDNNYPTGTKVTVEYSLGKKCKAKNY